MLPDQQDRVVVVLVRARNPSNIGAVARAMHDLGFAHLRVVNDYPVPFEAAKSAVDASHVLAAATMHASLAEAVADCTFVFGTTAVGERVLEHPVHPIRTGAALARTALADPNVKVALLFGSEKTGLSNVELSHCHALVTIPMNPVVPKHLSMNLGQAAAVCLYELAQRDDALPSASASTDPAAEPALTAAEAERLTSLLAEVLDRSGYARRHPANARENNIRRLVRRMAVTAADAPVWTGILRQILHALGRDGV